MSRRRAIHETNDHVVGAGAVAAHGKCGAHAGMFPELGLELLPSLGVFVLVLDTGRAEGIVGTENFHGFLLYAVGGF